MADIDSEISGQVNHLNTINAQIKESEIKILNLEIQHSDLITSLNHIIFHANQFMNLLEHIVLAINDKITLQSPKALILLIYDFDHHDKEKDSK